MSEALPDFQMCSSHWKEAKFLLSLGISRKFKIPQVKKICILKWLLAQVKIGFCVHEKDVLVCAGSRLRHCFSYLEWQADTILFNKKKKNHNIDNDQGITTINI